MKKFFMAFLGTLAGIWFSLLIAFFGLIILIAVAGAASIESLGSGKTVRVDGHSYLMLSLSGEISDRPGKIDPIAAVRGDSRVASGLNEIVGAIGAAAYDDRIEGVVVECRGASAGLAQRQAIVEALHRFKDASPGKWVYAYGDIYTQGDYYIASAADMICVNPIGQIDIHGLSSTNLYFKNMLDKLGVDVQVVKVGTYKSAVEPYTLTGISEPAREQQQLFLSNIWHSVAREIASSRGVDPDAVDAWADSGIYAVSSEEYVKNHIADSLMYRHEFYEMVADATGMSSVDDLRPVTPSDYCKVQDVNVKGDGNGATIAVLYACGDITDETGDGIVAKNMVPEILSLADDEDIDGLVMYVNSGGGSAFASEQIWEALQQWKSITGKPFYVSMSDYAASGGYYISCGADRIYAQPTTLTGSIGIFGLIPDMHGLLSDKLGVNTSTVSTNPGGAIPSLLEPMTPAQRTAMQGYVERGYELFASRCAQGRGMSTDSIKMIAEGRVWDGAEALKLGLIDELGGLDAAISGMAERLGAASWTIRNYPARNDKWYELLLEAGYDIKSAMVRDELGEMASLYDTMARIKDMSALQARMEIMDIQL